MKRTISLSDWPPQLTLEVANQYVQEKKRDELIGGYCRRAFLLSGRFAATWNLKHCIDDLDSMALEGVIGAIDKILNGKVVKNVEAYVTINIKRTLLRGVRSLLSKTKPLPVELGKRFVDSVELKDLIDYGIRSPLDKMIVELRGQGYTDQQIGEQLGIPWWTLRRMRLQIARRIQGQML